MSNYSSKLTFRYYLELALKKLFKAHAQQVFDAQGYIFFFTVYVLIN